jgi:hypothetical protein
LRTQIEEDDDEFAWTLMGRSQTSSGIFVLKIEANVK